VLSLRTRGPRAIRSARPQRAKLTPASVTPANASDFATTPRGPDPRECGSGARARASLPSPADSEVPPQELPLSLSRRSAPGFDRARLPGRPSRGARRCAARANPRFEKPERAFRGRRNGLRGSRTTRSRIALPDRVFRLSRQIFHRSSTQETPRVSVTRSHKNPAARPKPPKRRLSLITRGVSTSWAFCFLCNICLLPSYEYVMSDVLRDVKVYHDTLVTLRYRSPITRRSLLLLEPGVFGL
jgi:hypothetical protein